MLPIRAFLNRIRWDPALGTEGVELGLWDRQAREIQRVPLRAVIVEEGNPFFVSVTDARGTVHSVPLHRVRRVWRNGELLWSRQKEPGGGDG